MQSHDGRRVLLTGATGYVGGRLRLALEEAGCNLRCMARWPANLKDRVRASTEVVKGDVFEPESLASALQGVHTAYYLIHSMGSSGDFESQDLIGATNFATAAKAAGVQRIVYLGGLGDDQADLSPHLRSRQQVGRVLRDSGVPTIELRASIVIGSGSLSFEMVRALVDRLPVMITPRWTTVMAQPIGIRDLISYLVACLELEVDHSRIYEVGGADRVSYHLLMKEYARQRGLRRWMIRVPFMTPGLSSRWLGFVTPIYARVGRKLIDSIRHPTVVTNDDAARDFSIRPMPMSEAIERALQRDEQEFLESRWSDAISSGGDVRSWGGVRFGRRLGDRRTTYVAIEPAAAFRPIESIGGRNGWYAFDWLWRLRGFIDLLVGGVGMRRGRPHPNRVSVGDALDFWRVARFEPNVRLRLRAEMRLPGRAWLEFEVQPEPGGSRIVQTAIFDPVGLGGLAYWYLVYPLHALVFRRMLAGVARKAIQLSKDR